ncbi:MAG: hypothetical protein RL211_1072 [Pseudomonadota bacterium]|jgi:hypothetical protein
MQLATYVYAPATGWNRPLNPGLDSAATWVIIFGGSGVDELMHGMNDLRQAYPLAAWMGCSTAGEIHGNSLGDNSLVVAVMKFAHTQLRMVGAKIENPEESAKIGAQLGAELAAPDLAAVFLLSDGLSVNGSRLIESLSGALKPGVVVTGGLAGDGDRFHKTWVIQDKKPQAHYVTAVGLYGDRLGVAHGSRGGWDVLGPEREVTRSRGNVLLEIDGQPALTLYKKYLGDRADGLPATGLLFPLAIRNQREEDGLTVRTILSVSEAENSIVFAGDIPQGSFVRLMRANFERLIDGAAQAASCITLDDYQGGPMLTVGISCIGRRLVLGQRTEEEIDAVRKSLPQDSELVGYYSYGELSPLTSGRCDLHNQTMTLSTFWEK